MVKFLIGFLVLIIAVLGAVLVVKDDPGFVLIRYGEFSIETSLAFGIAAVAVIGLLIQLALRILLAIYRLPRTLKKQAHQRRVDKSRRLLSQGLIDLAEGRFEQSETNLMKLIDYSENPLLNYLAAARAAQQQGKYDQRDNYLKHAHDAKPEAEVAIGVTQAELQLASKQTERALATLSHLRSVAPKHDYVLKLLARVYYMIEEWSKLCDLLPEVRRKKLLDDKRLKEYEVQAFNGCLDEAAERDGDNALENAWGKLPKAYQTNADLILHYVDLVSRRQQDNESVARIIVKSINQQWDTRLVDYYGRLMVKDSSAQLATAEGWLKEYGGSDVLLLALGRICIRLKLWGKAQSYLEASVGSRATRENCLELANLLMREELDAPDKACEYYRQGLDICLEQGR